jgi:hypothetical protein
MHPFFAQAKFMGLLLLLIPFQDLSFIFAYSILPPRKENRAERQDTTPWDMG